MSNHALNWAFGLPFAGPKKGVIVALANSAGPNGVCEISMKRLRLHSGYAERPVQRALNELQGLGAISERDSVGGRRRWSHFELNLDYPLPKATEQADPATVNGIENPVAPAGFHPAETDQNPATAAPFPVETPPEGRGNGAHEVVNTPPLRTQNPATAAGLRLPNSPRRLPLTSLPQINDHDPGESAGRAHTRAHARTTLPKCWKPNPQEERYAADLGLSVPLVAAKFAAWHRKEGTRSPDWSAAWEFWCLDQVERNEQSDSRGNGFVKVIDREGWVSSRRNGHDPDAESDAAFMGRLVNGHA